MSAALVVPVRPAMDENLMVPFPALRSPEAQFPENVLLSAAFTHLRSLSGSSSTVAIDNKIEQAMDLVKTHLMFAVREEVEVLKEQIKELMERIGNLEWENSYLRANVPPEVLTRMAQTPRSLPSSSSS